MSKSDTQPLGPATRHLIGPEAAAEHDRVVLISRLEGKMDQVRRFLIWMDEQGIPREQITIEWFNAVAPMLPEGRAAPKRQSKREREWTWLLADILYLERNGFKGRNALIICDRCHLSASDGKHRTPEPWRADYPKLGTRAQSGAPSKPLKIDLEWKHDSILKRR